MLFKMNTSEHSKWVKGKLAQQEFLTLTDPCLNYLAYVCLSGVLSHCFNAF